MTQRIALLVDGDNLSPAYAARIMAEAAKLGRVDLVRVYGNAAHPSDWLTMPGCRMVHAGCGKNAADVLLCIDAMELALTGDWGGFVIASSDGDFVHLAQRLRERGLTVVGIGEAKAPAMFGQACTRFVTIGSETVRHVLPVQPGISPVALPRQIAVGLPQTSKSLSKIEKQVRDIIGIAYADARGMTIQELSSSMWTRHQFRISSQPEKNWRSYLKARPALYVLHGQGAAMRVTNNMHGALPAQPKPALAAE